MEEQAQNKAFTVKFQNIIDNVSNEQSFLNYERKLFSIWKTNYESYVNVDYIFINISFSLFSISCIFLRIQVGDGLH